MYLEPPQIDQFHRDGFLHVPAVFDSSDFAPVKEVITEELDKRCEQLLAKGLISDEHQEAPFEQRFGRLIEQTEEIQAGFDIAELSFDEFFNQLSHPKMLDMIESILGSNLSINPIHHLRSKPPAHQKEMGYYSVPWHQDAGVLTEDTDDHLILTAWYPLGEATKEMGCMSLIPGVPKGTLLPHVKSDLGTTIHSELMPAQEPVLTECHEGDVIIMSQWCPHHSTSNMSNKCRWSMDTRYHVTGTPSGRDWYPSTPVRSIDGSKIVTDPAIWRKSWKTALASDNPGAVHRISDEISL
jgi:ectoine hydroxylase-related dioxygenase (phytanoyl-CoA dioxygenase family)